MNRCRLVRRIQDLAGAAEDFLVAEPFDCSKLLTSLAGGRRDAARTGVWAWVEDDAGRVLAVGHVTAPGPDGQGTGHDLTLSPGPREAGELVAEALRADGVPVAAVEGPAPVVEAFVTRWCSTERAVPQPRPSPRPSAVELSGLGVYVADEVVPPPGVPGRMRRAVPPDATLLDDWGRAFVLEADGQSIAADLVSPRIRSGIIAVWEVDGVVVSMAAALPHAGAVSRVQLVYTPPEHRRRGYAAALVASLSRREVAAGNRCTLFTDLANPTTNRIYPAVGYRRTGTLRRIRFVEE